MTVGTVLTKYKTPGRAQMMPRNLTKSMETGSRSCVVLNITPTTPPRALTPNFPKTPLAE